MRPGDDGRIAFGSNHAGGVLGGISTGQPVVARIAIKPTSSILISRDSVDVEGQRGRGFDEAAATTPASASARFRLRKR